MKHLLRRLADWLELYPVPAAPLGDRIGDNLRDAIVAETRAKAANFQCHQARVETMIEDLFTKFGNRDVRRHP